MRVKDIRETHNDYCKSSLLISTINCDWKCENEGLCPRGSCQNSELLNKKTIEVPNDKIIDMFNSNIFVDAVVIGGLEPFIQFEEIIEFISEFRKNKSNDIVIFAGYYPSELQKELLILKTFKNIIVKFGRFIANDKPIYDSVLGVELASSNQWAEKIS